MTVRALGASVEPAKVVSYLLAPDHPDNGGKADFFHGFGFRSEEWEALARALLAHQAANPVCRTREVAWGRLVTVECSMVTPDGRSPCIHSVWAEDAAGRRLVTAYPAPRPKRLW